MFAARASSCFVHTNYFFILSYILYLLKYQIPPVNLIIIKNNENTKKTLKIN